MFIDSSKVAVIGAGPAGLAVACLLQTEGHRVTVIEARRERDNASRATGLRHSSLYLLDQLGLREAVLTASCILAGMQIYRDGTPLSFLAFPGSAKRPVDNLSVPQPALEAILKRRALELDVSILTGTRLIDLVPGDDHVRLKCADAGGEWQGEAPWLIGADGARSTVRSLLGLSYDGDFEPEWSFVFDCALDRAFDPSIMHYFISGERRLAVMPLDAKGRTFKLSGSLPDDIDVDASDDLVRDAVERLASEVLGARIGISLASPMNRYRVSRRLASVFSVGRCFLIGDAAHSCPPNGGWGLNTAFADAANLAWKLSGVIGGTLFETVLQSYATERRAAAAEILAFTDAQRRKAFAQTAAKDDDEDEFLTHLACDGDMTVASRRESVWRSLTPGCNLREMAARRPELSDLPTLPPGMFSILVNRPADGVDWLQALCYRMAEAGQAVRPIMLPCEGPDQAALVRPDGVLAVLDGAPGNEIAAWVTRRSVVDLSRDAR